MPKRPLRPCLHPGCPALVQSGRCDKHNKTTHREYDRNRGSSTERGYGSRWQKERLAYLRQHPLCVECMGNGDIIPATVVDHVIPHKGNNILFWDVTNWQPLCKRCHDIKTATEDGGWGRGHG